MVARAKRSYLHASDRMPEDPGTILRGSRTLGPGLRRGCFARSVSHELRTATGSGRARDRTVCFALAGIAIVRRSELGAGRGEKARQVERGTMAEKKADRGGGRGCFRCANSERWERWWTVIGEADEPHHSRWTPKGWINMAFARSLNFSRGVFRNKKRTRKNKNKNTLFQKRTSSTGCSGCFVE